MTLELCIVMNWVSCVLTVLFGCSDLLLSPPSQAVGYGKLSGPGSGTSTRSKAFCGAFRFIDVFFNLFSGEFREVSLSCLLGYLRLSR